MNLDLQGKRAVICGSTQGIGRACAIELALLGANVTLLARDVKKLEELKSQLPNTFNQSHNFLVADFNFPDQVRDAMTDFTKSNAVHILVNNTGGPPGGPVVVAKPEEFINAFSAHLLCNQHLVQAVVDGMKKAGFGRIINIISTSVKMPIPGLGVSNTIRGAVANWAKTLSFELASFGITVNNVLPGATKTGRLDAIVEKKAEQSGRSSTEIQSEMIHEIPARRIGSPEEVAAAVAFLASPAAAYVNGINLPVDGGRTGSL